MKITAKRIKKRWIAGGIVIVAAAVGIALFVKAKGSKDTVNAGSGQQSTVQLLKQDLVESISATGAFESATNKSVTSTATNLTVKKVLVAVGDTVQKGDSLVKFDQSDLEDAYADAKDNLSNTTTSANAEVTNAKKQLSNAQTTYSDSKTSSAAAVKKTKASLQTLKKTIRSLKDKIKVAKDAARKTALQQELSQAREQLTQAQEKYEQAVSNQTSGNRQNQSSVDSAKTAVEQAETNRTKQIKEAQKQVKEAKENLDNCAVTAPVSGTVTDSDVNKRFSIISSILTYHFCTVYLRIFPKRKSPPKPTTDGLDFNLISNPLIARFLAEIGTFLSGVAVVSQSLHSPPL